MKSNLSAALLAPVLAPVLAFSSLPAWADEPARQIIVTGQGEVTAAPDIATLSLGVRQEAETTGAALDAASEAMAAILDAAAEAGIPPQDIRTGQLRLSIVYASSSISGRRQVTGYMATNDIIVTLRDLEGTGALISNLVGEGVNDMSGLSFGIDDPSDLLNAARQDAVADAMAKARLLADAAGIELGDVLRLEEAGAGGGGYDMPVAEFRAMSAPQMDVPVAPGELTFSAGVTMVWEIEDE